MVFSSIPAYLDTSNWHQQPNHQLIGSSSTNPLLPPPPHSGPPPPPPPPPHGSVGAGSIRPGSMAERARMANIPLPETALKCPRCESTNTKFCYFNNYSLSQPRHFCKTCRRYWTRGGALRNVPVGGGCRRNKRSKSGGGSSKSPASSGDRQNNNTNPTATTTTPASTTTSTLLGLTSHLLQPLRFMSPLSQITDHFNTDNMGLNYSGITSPLLGNNDINFHGGNPFQAAPVAAGIEAWRMQQVPQFPYLSSLDPSQQVGMYQFQGGESAFMGGVEMSSHQMRPRLNACVKMEESHPPHLNLSRQMLAGGIQGNEHWNGTNAWTELSSFSSSSTSNPL